MRQSSNNLPYLAEDDDSEYTAYRCAACGWYDDKYIANEGWCLECDQYAAQKAVTLRRENL